jgi:hypothetical protein
MHLDRYYVFRPEAMEEEMRRRAFPGFVAAAILLVVLLSLPVPEGAAGETPATVETPANSGVVTESPTHKGWEIGARVAYWFSTVDGDLRVDGNGIRGSTINLRDDLGISRADMGCFEIFGQYGRHHVTVGYLEADYSGSNNIPREIIAKGQTYPAGSLVEGNVRLKVYEFEYQYDFLRRENILSGLTLGAIAKILYTEGHTSSYAPALGLSGQGNFYAPIPMLGIGAQIGILPNWLEFRGKLTGSHFSGNTFLGADAAFSLTLLPFTELSVGYKYIQYDYEKDNVLLDITMSGPYVGLTIKY